MKLLFSLTVFVTSIAFAGIDVLPSRVERIFPKYLLDTGTDMKGPLGTVVGQKSVWTGVVKNSRHENNGEDCEVTLERYYNDKFPFDLFGKDLWGIRVTLKAKYSILMSLFVTNGYLIKAYPTATKYTYNPNRAYVRLDHTKIRFSEELEVLRDNKQVIIKVIRTISDPRSSNFLECTLPR